MPADHGVAVALLAAGRSSRFGNNKLEARLGGIPLWRWAASAAEKAGFRRLVLVRSEKNDFMDRAEGWQIAINPDANEGIASSIRTAVRAAEGAPRLLLLLADMPFVSSQHLIALAEPSEPAFTRYPGGNPGVPAGFPASTFDDLSSLSGNCGAASLKWPGAQCVIPPASDHELMDVDTPESLRRAEMLLPTYPPQQPLA